MMVIMPFHTVKLGVCIQEEGVYCNAHQEGMAGREGRRSYGEGRKRGLGVGRGARSPSPPGHPPRIWRSRMIIQGLEVTFVKPEGTCL